MLRVSLVVLTALALWAATAGIAVVSVDRTPVRWHAEVGFLVVAAAVVGAWLLTDRLLHAAGLKLPYRPE